MNTITGLLDSGQDEATALLGSDGAALDWRTVRGVVAQLADQLRSAGVGPADRVAIVMPDGVEMALISLAVMTVGCAAPLNPTYVENEYRFHLEDLGVRVLITPEGAMPAAHAAAPTGTRILYVRGRAASLDLVCDQASPVSGDTPEKDRISLALHTSGTTSRPKIVALRQSQLVRSALQIAETLQLTDSDRSLIVMPLFHIHGLLIGLLAPLVAGGSVVCTPGFDPFEFHGWLRSHEPTYYTASPTVHQNVVVMGRPRANARTSLRFVRSASAALPRRVEEDLRELFGVPVIEAYGLTESSGQVTSNPLPPATAKPGSVGLPTGVEVRILDKTGAELPPERRGEVGLRGPTLIAGYENNPVANETTFNDGWFRTGDEGHLDEDGYLYLTGRLKEQINRGGEKVGPWEIDKVVLENPAVVHAVSFAIPHPTLGEDIGVAVTLEPESQITADELRTFMAARLAPFKVPTKIVFVDEIPKGPTGKLQRRGLANTLGLTDGSS